jgi:FkbM family methyltransferase
MRRVWENPDEAKATGERARRDIEENLSLKTIGKVMRTRLETPPPTPDPPVAPSSNGEKAPKSPKRGKGAPERVDGGKLQAAQQILKQGPAVEAPSRLGRAGRLVRQLVLRSMRPFAFYQEQFDTALVGALQETVQRVRSVGSRVERLEASTSNKLEQRVLELEGKIDSFDARLSAIAEGEKLGGVPVRRTSYLGRPFEYPCDSLIGEVIESGEEWDAVLAAIVAELLPEDEPVVCEVGANIGASLLQILRVRPHARVVALEPSTRFLPLLERNLEAAGFGHVEVLPLLAGREPGSMELYNNASTASVVSADYDGHKPCGKHSAEMTTLDEVFRDRAGADFIKIDMDGFDFEALRGAEATLKRDRPALYFKIATHPLSEPVADLAWLQGLGYRRLVCVKPQGKLHGRILIHGITEDPEQVVAWSRETGLCDVLACPESSPYEARLERINFV